MLHPPAALDETVLSGWFAGCVYWQSSDKADFAFFDGETLTFEDHYAPRWSCLQELRLFCEREEIFLWKTPDGFAGRRMRVDEASVPAANAPTYASNVFLQKVKLWGTRAEAVGGGLLLTEDRGMRLWLPCPWESRFADGINVFLEEHRYLEEDETGCVYFADRRFVQFWVSDTQDRLVKLEVRA
jgi:CRISPR-associated protein (TIGR03984 family)